MTEHVKVVALDGNHHAPRLFEQVMKTVSSHISLDIDYEVAPIRIDDLYDLSILDDILSENSEEFDIIMTFKAICEFVAKERFEQKNPYKHFVQTFLPKLKDDGMMLLVDVSTYSNVSQEWLPKMIDLGFLQVSCRVVWRNPGYNQTFRVSHSSRQGDISKVVWRIIKKINTK